MTLKQDIRLASSVARPVADSLYTNITTDLGAMLRRRHYPHIHETSFDPVTAANPYPGYAELLAGPRVPYNRKQNIFILSRYDDVRAAARNDAMLTNTQGVTRSRVEIPVLPTWIRRVTAICGARCSLRSRVARSAVGRQW